MPTEKAFKADGVEDLHRKGLVMWILAPIGKKSNII